MQTNNFTFDVYRTLLKQVKKNYRFISYEDAKNASPPSILWRHDVDASVHYAYKLACIEKEEGISASYLFMLGNWFYDIREKELRGLIHKIKDLGHCIGLHYDFDYLTDQEVKSIDSFLMSLGDQKKEIEKILGIEVTTFSFHNPSLVDSNLLNKINKAERYLGMVNIYSNSIKEKFKYCSDSNGMWRFDKLEDIIVLKTHPYLHLLTHPEWWTEESLTPRQKIEKCLKGRVKSILRKYDETLAKDNRPNF